MSFDEDVLSALEEAFGSDSAALIDGLDEELFDAASDEDSGDELSLEEVVSGLDQEIVSNLDGADQKPLAPRSRTIDEKHVLVFLGDACFGLPMKNIVEIQQLPPVTFLPNLPDWIPGVCNLRGNIVSIVDLKQLLGFDPTVLSAKTRLVLVRTENQELTTGFAVDEVARIVEIEPGRIRPPVGRLDCALADYLEGTYETANGVVSVLNLEATLNSPTLRMC